MGTAPATLPQAAPLRAPSARPHEVRMAGAAVRLAAPLTPLVVVPAYLLRGAVGAGTALFVVALVVGSFALTGWSHALASKASLTALSTVAIGGALFRFALYAGLLTALRPAEVLDPTTLVIATPVVVITLLAYEVRFVASHPELSFVEVADRTDRKERA